MTGGGDCGKPDAPSAWGDRPNAGVLPSFALVHLLSGAHNLVERAQEGGDLLRGIVVAKRDADSRLQPQRFVETMRGLRSNAEKRIDDIVYSLLRDVLGKKSFDDILKREFLTEVKDLARAQLSDFGITVIDVRLKRADLPEANEQAVYQRMMSERQQIAQRFRAEGEQQAQRIRAEADRKVKIIVAEAQKLSEELKGEGDAQALEIYANAYNQDTAFFQFWRTLESYKLSLAQNSTLVLSSDSEYLRLLGTMRPAKGREPAGSAR